MVRIKHKPKIEDGINLLEESLKRRFEIIFSKDSGLSKSTFFIEIAYYAGTIVNSEFIDHIESSIRKILDNDSSEYQNLASKVAQELPSREEEIFSIARKYLISPEAKELVNELDRERTARIISAEGPEERRGGNISRLIIELKREGYEDKIKNFIVRDSNRDYTIIPTPSYNKYIDSLKYFREIREYAIWKDWDEIKRIYLGAFQMRELWIEANSSEDPQLGRLGVVMHFGSVKNAIQGKKDFSLEPEDYRMHLLRVHNFLLDLFPKLPLTNEDLRFTDYSKINIHSVTFDDKTYSLIINKDRPEILSRKSSHEGTEDTKKMRIFALLWDRRSYIKDGKEKNSDQDYSTTDQLIRIADLPNQDSLGLHIKRFNKWFRNRKLPIKIAKRGSSQFQLQIKI